MKKRFRSILTASILVGSMFFVCDNFLTAGCGIVVRGDCVDSYSHYQSGTSLPCVGNCGGCVYTQCGLTIEE